MRGSIKGGRGIGGNFLASVMWQKKFAFRGSLPLVKCVTVWAL